MHAFLFIGHPSYDFAQELSNLAQKYSLKIIDFSLSKIEDVRNLNKLLKLGFSQPTLIVSRNIHETTEEALNALLKNLEEPQINIYFALTATTEHAVLSTIASRCQIIKVNQLDLKNINEKVATDFLSYGIGEKLATVAAIKNRLEGIQFVENLIYHLRSIRQFDKIQELLTALTNIKKNGNVLLQLTNLVVRMENANA